jgi:hypothetical protein
MQAMRLEHCASYGHDVPFITPNYGIEATPEKEWAFVVEGEQPATNDMGHGRTILDLAHTRHWTDDDLTLLSETDDPSLAMSAERMLSSRDLVNLAGLQRSEVAAVILYTGPMVCARHPSPFLFLLLVVSPRALSCSST